MNAHMKNFCRRIRDFRLELWPSLYTALILLGATLLSAMLHKLFIQNNNVSIIYTLAVVIVACVTPGYFYGSLAAVISVIGINYFFTLPYWGLDFTQTGYPITFFTLLVASVLTSTLVTGYRERDRVRMEMESERLRSSLLQAVSHDLRTPLTVISGDSDALLDDEDILDAATRRALATDIRDNAQWLIRMVENLLSVTRIRDKAPIEKTPDMAEEVLAQAAGQVRRRFPAQELSLLVPEEPLVVPMDGTLIEQVLINLAENAIFHSETTAPIEMHICRERDNAVFTVRDHGVGIEEEYIRRLFAGHLDPERTNDRGRGMGIGLSICAAIIAAHGGVLDAYNAEDGGAVFRFTLPLETEDAPGRARRL